VRLAPSLAKAYFADFPMDTGKWRAWRSFQRTPSYQGFAPGVYATRYGFAMRLDPREQIDRFIYFWKCWEPNESRLIASQLRAGDVFVDVGANDGYFSFLASGLVGATGVVVLSNQCRTPQADSGRMRQSIHRDRTSCSLSKAPRTQRKRYV